MSEKTHEEWLVLVKQNFRKDSKKPWYCAKLWYPSCKGLNDFYCSSEKEARKVLDHAYELWNGTKVYDSNGKRYETSPAGYLSVSVEHTKETDKDLMIVEHQIRKRIVSNWEIVE